MDSDEDQRLGAS